MNTAVFRTVVARRRSAASNPGPAEYRSGEANSFEHAPSRTPAPRVARPSITNERWCRPATLRTALLVGSLAAALFAWFATSRSVQAVDPELAVLLRGMAAIKGLLVVSATGLVWWRLGQPVSPSVAFTYIACVALLFAGTVLIWQLAFVAAAAVLFHAAGFVGLVVAMREGYQKSGLGRQAPDPSFEQTS